MKRRYNDRLIEVEEIESMSTPWYNSYDIYKDDKGYFYYDLTDDAREIARANGDLNDAREELRRYIYDREEE